MMIDNYISNAYDHAKGKVLVKVENQRLEVINDGEMIEIGKTKEVIERYNKFMNEQ